MEFSLADIDRFICHPGGAKVIAALERALSLEQGALDHEREVIADYGNMSAPTVLFVLRARDGAGPADALAADRARTRLHRELRCAAARRVSLASIILALVTLQRLGELVLARRNTRALLARGAIEIGAGHYPLIVAVHAAWLIALWVLGRNQEVNLPGTCCASWPCRACVSGCSRRSATRWTTRIIVLPGEAVDHLRTLSLFRASQLCGGRRRDRAAAARAASAAAGADLHGAERRGAHHPDPRRGPRARRTEPMARCTPRYERSARAPSAPRRLLRSGSASS